MPIAFEPEFEPETKASKSFAPAFEPEFEEEKPTKKKGASSIPGAEEYDAKEEYKKQPFSFKDVAGPLEAAATVATGIPASLAGVGAGFMGSAIDLTKGKLTDPREIADRIAQRFTYAPSTEQGEDALKAIAPAMDTLQALGPTGYGASSVLSKTTKARMAAAEVKQAELLKAFSDANKPEPAPKPLPPIEAAPSPDMAMGPSKGLAEAADVAKLREALMTDSVGALKERVTADTEMRDANLKQLQELAAKDAAEQAKQRPNLTSLEDEHGQQSLFDQQDLMGKRDQFNAGQMGEWAVDENGMPVRAPKGEEVQVTQAPLQPDLFNAPENPLIGNPIDRSQASLKALQEPVKALPELEKARMEAEGHKFGFEPEATEFQPTNPLPTKSLAEVMREEQAKKEALVQEAPTKEAAAAHAEHQASGKEFPNEPLVEGKTTDKTGREWNTKVTQEFRNGEISVTVGVHDPETGRRAGVVEFRVNSDGTISAENAIVSANMKGRGLSQSMYQAAKDAGYDIVPGRYQTAEGAAMVKNLQEKGIIGKGDITPLPAPEALPPVPPNHTRMYHGGEPQGSGPLWFSKSQEYAKNYGGAVRDNKVWYVDVPNDHPSLKGYSDYGVEIPTNLELPASIADQRKLIGSKQAQEARLEGDRTIKAAEEYLPSDKPYKTPEESAKAIPVTGKAAEAVTAMKDIPGYEGKMRHFEPVEMPTAQFLEKYKDTPDINQNIVQKGFNWTTKGSTYLNTRIDDPFFKRTTDRFKMAEDNIQAAVGKMIHQKGGLAPSLRSLSKEDYTRLPQVIMEAWKNEVEVTPDMLRGMGFSEKAITVNETIKKFQDKLFNEYLKPAADLAGIKNVSQDVSYYASRATGDFRVRVYKGDRPLGQLSANTKIGLMNEIRKYNAESKGQRIGEREYYGGSGKNASKEGMSQLYQYLAENDPEMAKSIAEMYEGMKTQSAADFMGTKKHTMEKQGLFGMAGDNPNAKPYDNAKAFWDSQVQASENVIRWAEISKAMEDTKEISSLPNRPNTNALIKRYVDNAMGRNPSSIGRAWDNLYANIGEVLGIGTTLPKEAIGGIKKAVNIKLLAASTKFYLGNVLQQMTRSPELAATLYARGLKVRDIGLSDMVLGMMDAVTDKNAGAQAYAEKHHIYSSDLFETSNRTRKGFGHYTDMTTKPAAAIEQYTRKSFYLTAVRTLERNGYSGDKLYGTAHELTNVFMNNYNPNEARMASTAALGTSVGRGANNLMSYSHNEISRLAMHLDQASEGLSKGEMKMLVPLATNVITNVAMAGLVGTVGYKEADYIVKKISELVGKPTSLSAVLTKSDGTAADIVKYGIPSYYTGMDLTQSFGGGNIVPDMSASPMDLAVPGLGSLVDAGVSTAKAVANPTEFNIKKAIRDAAPNGPVQGLLDRIWGSKLGEPDAKTGKTPEMGINWNKITGQVRRDDTDKRAKTLGMTSLRESMIKNQDYAQDQIDKFYSDKRKDAVIDMKEALFTKNKKDMQAGIQKYIKNEGDASKLDGDLEKAVQDQNISIEEANLIRAQKGDLPAAKSLIRRMAR